MKQALMYIALMLAVLGLIAAFVPGGAVAGFALPLIGGAVLLHIIASFLG